ncbi:DegT/DnrJ/EryC1/StrS family aminotransferase [Thalassospira lucentensis]|uniref:DegT/DnrJ/EryC1/StrS family aminotransferase n=1 Tax=Thalassospira lucentensis TaxID=168935 RepID=UPI003D2EF8DD
MNKLNLPAILGGSPIRSIPLPRYNMIGAEEKAAVMDVLNSGELSGFVASSGPEFHGGEQVQALEKAFCEKFGSLHAISVNSATSGLHCALAAMGIGPGDEVLVPPYTMSASATTVLFTGAVPIFVDVEDSYFCIDPKRVEQAITARTKGIVAVNLFGQSANLNALRKIADEHNLFLVEDNAQAPGALHHEKFTGTIGDAGVFSFNRHKTMQSGEGGVVLTNDGDLALRMRLMRNHGEVVVGAMNISNIVNTVGLNYRMTEMEAAVARVQVSRLDALNAPRIALANRLTEGLQTLDGIMPPQIAEGNTHVYYFYPLLFDASQTALSREQFCKSVEAEGFTLRAGYVKPLYLEPLYQQKICFGREGFPFSANTANRDLVYEKGICPVVEDLAENRLMVTNITYPPLTISDMDDFVEACRRVLAHAEEIIDAGIT